MLLGVFLFVCTACADTEQPRVVLGPGITNTEIGPGTDLTGKQLAGCVFVGQDFRGAVFDDCDFFGCRICQCDFRGVSFKRANFNGLQLGDCDFEGADFADAIINGIERYDGRYGHDYRLTAKQFTSTLSYRTKNLKNCFIAIAPKSRSEPARPRFDFRDARLDNSIFTSTNLSECNFTGADITGMKVIGGSLAFEQIKSTRNFPNLTRSTSRMVIGIDFAIPEKETTFSFARFEFYNCTVRNIFHVKSSLRDVIFSRCRLTGGKATGRLEQTRNFKRGDLSDLVFLGVDFSRLDFSKQNLTNCRFVRCDFSGAEFHDAVISGATFETVPGWPEWQNRNHLTLDQIKSTWNYKHGRMAGIRLPEKLAKAMKKEKESDKTPDGMDAKPAE